MKRLVYVDVAKGLGIILMVMGHVGFGQVFSKIIHGFHMPLFFIISGYLWRGQEVDFRKFLQKKFRVLLVPYIIWGLFFFIIDFIFSFSVRSFIHLLTINTRGLPIAGALWFLTALFLTETLYYLIEKYSIYYVIIPLFIIGCVADRILPYPLPWAISPAFVGIGLYWIGHLFRKNESVLGDWFNMPAYKIGMIACVVCISIMWNGNVNMREGSYAIIPLFLGNAIGAFFVVISISKKIEDKWRGRRICRWLAAIGENSIVYVCLNEFIIDAMRVVLGRIRFFQSISILIVCLGICHVMSMLSKSRIKILFGR